MPADYQSGDPRPIPFADEKPVLVLNASNFLQYQDKISPGLQALFEKYPNFAMQIFPTHRTAIAPQYVYDYTHKNAIEAQLVAGGNGITGAYGGLPFPIPKNGYEVIWNHLLSWSGVTTFSIADAYTISSSGQVVLDARVKSFNQWPYYFENGEGQFSGFFEQDLVVPIAPPYEVGGNIVLLKPVNPLVEDTEAWTYLAGERRVRRAPELQFDTPNSLIGGIQNWDEVQIFAGKLVEYDINYLGVKEIYVPYNANKICYAPVSQQYLRNFLNPDLVRWELHRCRVIEMTVKPNARNVDARRIIYCDEDTGAALVGEVYDSAGRMWKFLHNMPFIYGDLSCVCSRDFFIVYDLHAGNYSSGECFNAETHPIKKRIAKLPPYFFTPGNLAASAGGY